MALGGGPEDPGARFPVFQISENLVKRQTYTIRG
jgi:hypothetical protein